MLTAQNFNKGFLIDDQVIGGVTDSSTDSANPSYVAYVSDHTTGETLMYEECSSIDDALNKINLVPRKWRYEAIGCSTKSACGSGTCTSCKC